MASSDAAAGHPVDDGATRPLLVHPLVLGALVVLVVNDQWAKGTFGNAVTGKLSDAAGAIVLTALLVAVVGAGRRAALGPAGVAGVAAAVVGVVTVVKVPGPGNAAGAAIAGLVRWPIDAAVALARHVPLPSPRSAAMVADPTDALAAVAGFSLALSPARRRPAEPPSSRTARSSA